MRALLGLAFATWAAFAAAASAQTQPVVVELFTSQGCSACPPADKLLHEIADRDDVIALALHVDYWDYIGWKDAFADPAHTERQRQYAIEAGRRSIYTPQMIVNGKTAIIGTKPMALVDAITEYAAMKPEVTLDIARQGDEVQIDAVSGGPTGKLIVHMVYYKPLREISITRGENAGNTLSYANVAQDWKILAEWNGFSPLSMSVPAKPDMPIVVLVQDGVAGPILAGQKIK